ncbi:MULTISPECIES: hypothetical protein [unclassified Methanosarcina]|jgi:hypothetical protein|nr:MULTISPECIES: hypothetical protein [unclassified Methanosarcina]
MPEEGDYYSKKCIFQTESVSDSGDGLVFVMAYACGIAAAIFL